MQQVILVSSTEFNNLKLRIIQAKKKDNVKYEWPIFNLEARSAERIELGKLAQPKIVSANAKKNVGVYMYGCPNHQKFDRMTRITIRHSQICTKMEFYEAIQFLLPTAIH